MFENVNFSVNEGDVVILRARSGSGKTTLLKCIAHLYLYHGTVEFRGKTPKAYGVPAYRTYVQYIPQRPSLLPGTPRDLFDTLTTFRARHAPERGPGNNLHFHRSLGLAEQWGIAKELWDRPWSQLSVGESQRLSLAIAHGLNRAEVLMLDEPTSGLDGKLSKAVEDTLMEEIKDHTKALKAIIWITHSDEQAERVGTRFMQLTLKGIEELHRSEL